MTSSSSQAAITNDMDFKLTITVTDNLVQSIRGPQIFCIDPDILECRLLTYLHACVFRVNCLCVC